MHQWVDHPCFAGPPKGQVVGEVSGSDSMETSRGKMPISSPETLTSLSGVVLPTRFPGSVRPLFVPELTSPPNSRDLDREPELPTGSVSRGPVYVQRLLSPVHAVETVGPGSLETRGSCVVCGTTQGPRLPFGTSGPEVGLIVVCVYGVRGREFTTKVNSWFRHFTSPKPRTDPP